jgi:hypothetical protein
MTAHTSSLVLRSSSSSAHLINSTATFAYPSGWFMCFLISVFHHVCISSARSWSWTSCVLGLGCSTRCAPASSGLVTLKSSSMPCTRMSAWTTLFLSGLLLVPRAAMLLSMASTKCAVMLASAIVAQGGRKAIRQRVFAAHAIPTKVVPSISLLVAPKWRDKQHEPGVRTLADARRPANIAPTRGPRPTCLGAEVEHPPPNITFPASAIHLALYACDRWRMSCRIMDVSADARSVMGLLCVLLGDERAT